MAGLGIHGKENLFKWIKDVDARSIKLTQNDIAKGPFIFEYIGPTVEDTIEKLNDHLSVWENSGLTCYVHAKKGEIASGHQGFKTRFVLEPSSQSQPHVGGYSYPTGGGGMLTQREHDALMAQKDLQHKFEVLEQKFKDDNAPNPMIGMIEKLLPVIMAKLTQGGVQQAFTPGVAGVAQTQPDETEVMAEAGTFNNQPRDPNQEWPEQVDKNKAVQVLNNLTDWEEIAEASEDIIANQLALHRGIPVEDGNMIMASTLRKLAILALNNPAQLDNLLKMI